MFLASEIRIYEDMDNQNEVLKIKAADFTYGYSITDISKVCKITMAS